MDEFIETSFLNATIKGCFIQMLNFLIYLGLSSYVLNVNEIALKAAI